MGAVIAAEAKLVVRLDTEQAEQRARSLEREPRVKRGPRGVYGRYLEKQSDWQDKVRENSYKRWIDLTGQEQREEWARRKAEWVTTRKDARRIARQYERDLRDASRPMRDWRAESGEDAGAQNRARTLLMKALPRPMQAAIEEGVAETALSVAGVVAGVMGGARYGPAGVAFAAGAAPISAKAKMGRAEGVASDLASVERLIESKVGAYKDVYLKGGVFGPDLMRTNLIDRDIGGAFNPEYWKRQLGYQVEVNVAHRMLELAMDSAGRQRFARGMGEALRSGVHGMSGR